MNIFGVGGMELVFILLIMLVVAGPKRMLRWAYVLGIYTAKLRRMWEETVDYLQKEFDDAGVDVKVPREMPTRASVNRAVSNAMKPVTQPVEETLNEVKRVSITAAAAAGNGQPRVPAASRPDSAETPETDSGANLGSWSGKPAGDLGSWSGSTPGDSEPRDL